MADSPLVRVRTSAALLAIAIALGTITLVLRLEKPSHRIVYGVWAQSSGDASLFGDAGLEFVAPTASGYRNARHGLPRQWPSFDFGFWEVYYPHPAGMRPAAALPSKASGVIPAAHRVRRTDGVDERLFPVDFRMDKVHMWPSGSPAKGANADWSLPRRRTWAIICRQFDISQLPPVHIVEFEPILTSPREAEVPPPGQRRARAGSQDGKEADEDPAEDADGESRQRAEAAANIASDISSARSAAGPNVDAVHHISLMLCKQKKPQYAFGQVFDCDQDGPDESCDEILVIYDRGAGTFRLPETVGSRIGALVEGNGVGASPLGVLVLEVHYLPALLPASAIPPNGFLDSSGLRLWVTPDLRAHDAKFFGLSDETMQLRPGREREDVDFTCPAETLRHQLGPAMKLAGGSVGVFAYHLHAHGLATALELEVVRHSSEEAEQEQEDDGGYGPGEGGEEAGQDGSARAGWLELLGRLNPFGGYNADQSLHYTGLRGEEVGEAQGQRLAPLVPGSSSPVGCGEEAGAAMQAVPVTEGGGGPCATAEGGGGGWTGVFGAEMEARTAKSPTVTAAGATVVPVLLRPGDALRARCRYNTTGRSQDVVFGLGLLNEMCAPIVWVYPVDGTQMLPDHPDNALMGGSCLRNDCVRSDEHVQREKRSHGQ